MPAWSTVTGVTPAPSAGAQVALVHRVVVAVPVQLHALARRLVPQRREVGGANQLRRRQLGRGPVELDRLVRIEGVHAAPAPSRDALGQHRRDPVAQVERLELEAIDEADPQQQRARTATAARRCPDTAHARPPAVSRLSSEHSSTNRTNACRSSCVRRHAQDDAGRRAGRVAHGAGVADRAVEADLIDAERRRRDTPIGRSWPGSTDEAERCVAAAELVAADGRQRLEHPVGRQHAADRLQQRDAGLAADRAVLEMLLDVVERDRRGRRAARRSPRRVPRRDRERGQEPRPETSGKPDRQTLNQASHVFYARRNQATTRKSQARSRQTLRLRSLRTSDGIQAHASWRGKLAYTATHLNTAFVSSILHSRV